MKSKSKDRSNSNSQKSQNDDNKKGKKSQNNNKNNETINEDFEEMLMNISLKKPASGFIFFIREQYKKEKEKRNITDAMPEFSKLWKKVSDKDRQKYQKMADEDKIRYEEHLALVRKNILDKPKKENVTSYRIFLDELSEKAIEEGKDPKEARQGAAEKWKKLSDKRRDYYEEQKEKVRDLYEDLHNSNKTISGYLVFVKEQSAKAREKDKTLTLKEISELWQKTKDSTKEKYEDLANTMREEREKLRDIYEIAFGVKPRKPIGAYRFFMMDMAKQGKFDGKNPIREAGKLWKATKDSDKEKYLRMAKRDQLAYMIKKIEFNNSIKKHYTRAKSAFNFYVEEQAKKTEVPQDSGRGGLFKVLVAKWKKTDESGKKKYKQMAEDDKKRAQKDREQMKMRVYEEPKRPAQPYARFIRDRMRELSSGDTKIILSEHMSDLGEEWKKLTDKNKDKYVKEYEGDLDTYKEQLEFFKENKYYVPEGEETQKRRRKSSAGKGRSQSQKKGKSSEKSGKKK
jgi:hypothetical protein